MNFKNVLWQVLWVGDPRIFLKTIIWTWNYYYSFFQILKSVFLKKEQQPKKLHQKDANHLKIV